MKKIIFLCATGILMLVFGNSYATPISLDTYNPSLTYNFDSRAGMGSEIVKISFDYNQGTNPTIDTNAVGTPAFRIRRLNDDGTDSWLGSFNIHTTSFNLDTDFGPYSTEMILTGENHFEFTMNQKNGLWDLAINGSIIDFTSPHAAFWPGKYFSDESPEAIANAMALYPGLVSGDPLYPLYSVGVGGTGAYRLEFAGASARVDENSPWYSIANGSYVDNIHVTPEPTTVLLLGFGLLGLAGVSRKKK